MFDPVPYVVRPSPAKCFAVARTRSGSLSWRGAPWKPSIAVSIRSTSAGSSPKDSYVRPQRSSRATQMHGANAHCGPVVRVSSPAKCSTSRTGHGARAAGSPVLDVADEPRVARGAQPDVVREDRRPGHVAVAVHRVDAVDERDVQTRG